MRGQSPASVLRGWTLRPVTKKGEDVPGMGTLGASTPARKGKECGRLGRPPWRALGGVGDRGGRPQPAQILLGPSYPQTGKPTPPRLPGFRGAERGGVGGGTDGPRGGRHWVPLPERGPPGGPGGRRPLPAGSNGAPAPLPPPSQDPRRLLPPAPSPAFK